MTKRAMSQRRVTENDLESLWRRAAVHPELREPFYRQLLESNILVQVQTEHGGGVVPAGVEIGVETWVRQDGAPVIPFFSSTEAFFQAVPSGGKCVVMRTYELFESQATGMAFYLNPGSGSGVEFPPAMVASLLATRGVLDGYPDTHN